MIFDNHYSQNADAVMETMETFEKVVERKNSVSSSSPSPSPSPGDDAYLANSYGYRAVTLATMALVEQQKLANMIAIANAPAGSGLAPETVHKAALYIDEYVDDSVFVAD